MSGAPRAEEAVRIEPVLASAVTLARRTCVKIVVCGNAAATTRVRAHRGRLVHALFNLIDNACRVTPEGGLVEVSVGASDDAAWIEICDRGPGPAFMPAPTGVATRVTRGVGAGDGHGLGLAATRRFLASFDSNSSNARAAARAAACTWNGPRNAGRQPWG